MTQFAEAHYQAILDSAVDAIITTDTAGIICYANPGASRLFGYNHAGFMGMSINQLMQADDARHHDQYMHHYLRTGERHVIGIGRRLKGRHRDGHVVHIDMTLSELVTDSGHYFNAIIRDVSQQVAMEAALQRNDQRLRLSLRFARLGTWEWDIRSNDLYWSETIPQLLGYSLGEVHTSFKAFTQAIHPDDRKRVLAAIDESVHLGLDYNIEHRVVWPDGSVHWLREVGDIHRDHDGQAVSMVGMVLDIDEQKRLEHEWIAARDAALQANQAKSEFLSRMSHELRTPLNAILGFSQLLQLDDNLTELQQTQIGLMLRAGEHLLSLITDVLDLSRIESGKISLQTKPLNLASILTEVTTLVQPQADQSQVLLHLHIDDCGATRVKADATRLKQIMLNLLTNAIKYNRSGGEVILRCERGEGQVLIHVEDTGIGIPADRLSELYRPFHRLVAEDNRREGTGIGLVITKHLVELMGGTLLVESIDGIGSHFWFDLPATN